MDLRQLKNNADTAVAELHTIMAEIQKLDAYVETSDDPDAAELIVGVILEKAETFEQLTEETKLALETYLEAQKSTGVAVDFSYTKLYNQILRG